jgi:autotransporter-associated beta strand protein
MIKQVVQTVAVLAGLSTFGADGTWSALSAGNWSDSTKWLDGIIANGDASTATMPFGYDVTPNQAVSLNRLVVEAPNFRLASSPGNVFTMKDSPVIEVAPFTLRAAGIGINHPITGDGGVLTIKGGNINVEAMGVFTNFSRVALQGVATLSPRFSRPLTDGDLKMTDSRVNNNSQQVTGFLLNGGKLIVGPGQNVIRTGYWEVMTLPPVIEREAQGTLHVTLTTNRMLLANAAALLNAEGRLPTWFLRETNSLYRFATHAESGGIVDFPVTKTDLAAATAADTIRVTNAVTLAQNASAGALWVASPSVDLAGQTLTLGAAGALGALLLDTSLTNDSGSVTFTGTEGLVIANGAVSVAPQLTGPMSLTVLAGMDNINATRVNTLLLNNAANDFSGGLHILVGTVSSTNGPSVFGTGPIHVRGHLGTYTETQPIERIAFGGQLHLQKGRLTNPLFLSGAGTEYALAALRVAAGAEVASPVTLTGPAAIRSDAGRAEISGVITGDYSVRFWPDAAGELVLSGLNTYTGGTLIVASPILAGAVPGVVRVAATGSLGPGPVENNGTLVLDAGISTFANPLTGSGTFMQTNDTTITFQNAVSQGGLFADKGAVAIAGATNAFGVLVGQSGQLQAAADTVVVLGNNTSQTGIFYGSLADGAGKLSLVKRGTNTQVLAGASTYTGETIVEAGTLRLGGDFTAEPLPALSVAPTLALDAANGNASVTTNGAGAVTAWSSQGTVAATFVQSNPAMMPVYDPQAMNGLGGIRFSGVKNGDGTAVTNRLSCTASGAIYQQTIYAVSHPTEHRLFAGLIGSTGADNGIRKGGGTGWDTSFLKWGVTGSGNFAINGIDRTSGFSYAVPHLLRTAVDTPQNIGSALSVGQFFDTAAEYPRALTGSMGEILMYPRRLSTVENSMITGYLMNKWKISAFVAPAQILPAATSMTVQKGAVLDFNGASQTFASLVSAGTLRNSSTNPVTVTFSSGKLAGTVEGQINFVKVGGGALTVSLAENSALSGTVTVTDGTVLLRSWRSEALPEVPGLTFHLDAAWRGNLETNAQNEVVTWKNTGVAGGDFVRDTFMPATTPPTFSAEAFGGRSGVRFSGTETSVTNRLRNTVNTVGRTFFFVTQTDAYCSNSGIFGPLNSDYGIRLGSATSWAPYRNGATDDGFGFSTNFFINGVTKTSFIPGTPYVFTVRANRDNWNKQWSLGNYFFWTSGIQSRGYNGLIGEVVAYNRLLTATEQQDIEAYLTRKWFGTKTADNDILPATTMWELGAGGTLDLGGTQQTFAGLAGAGGTVTNGTATISGTLEVSVAPDGTVEPFHFDTVVLADGLRIVFMNGKPVSGSVLLEGGSVMANPATFVVPSGLSVTLKDGKLGVYRKGSLIMMR